MILYRLKVGMWGDIYTLMSRLQTLDIEKMLGNMGVEVTFALYQRWIKKHN